MRRALLVIAAFALAQTAYAGGRSGKVAITIDPVDSVQIEMPDGSVADYGEEVQALLTAQFLSSGNYIVASPESPLSAQAEVQSASGGYQWPASVTPSAEVHIRIDGLSFETGQGGEHIFYGFNENFRTPFNDGTLQKPNEFPLKEVEFDPNWFDRTFDDQGTAPFDSQAGLDLGDGIEINALFAWVSLKYAFYQAKLHLNVSFTSPDLNVTNVKLLQVAGKGFFYDFAGGYESYSAGIEITRATAMSQAMQNAIGGSYSAIDGVMKAYPSLAKIDAILSDGTILLGTGPNSNVAAGTIYQPISDPSTQITIVSTSAIGSVAQLSTGSLSVLSAGEVLEQAGSGSIAPPPHGAVERALAAEVIPVTIPDQNLAQANLGNLTPQINWAQALVDSVADTIAFAYRYLRYKGYDAPYNQLADGSGSDSQPFDGWLQAQSQSASGKQIGLDQVFDPKSVRNDGAANQLGVKSGPVVAIIDSGVDYNHPVLHASVWVNAQPDPALADNYGWDFVSQDARPYDDGYHGTWMAGAVLSVAPQALIMPIKAFNPYGITSSAALYGAFQYAVDHGANVILCGWATRKSSAAIEMGVAYAQAHGVLVIAAAGDRGDDLSVNPAYPASLSKNYDNVIAVASVNAQDALVTVSGKFSNFDAGTVQIAAPGQSVLVLQPREDQAQQTSTGIAAAFVAGDALRKFPALQDYVAVKSAILSDADSVSGLSSGVEGGKRLHVR